MKRLVEVIYVRNGAEMRATLTVIIPKYFKVTETNINNLAEYIEDFFQLNEVRIISIKPYK